MGHHLYALATQNLMQFLNEKKFGVTHKIETKLPKCSCCAHKQKRSSRREEYSLSLSLSLSLPSSLLFSSSV